MNAKQRTLAVLSMSLGFGVCGWAGAQEWPQRPITMVITLSAGGGPDVVGRILAPQLSAALGRQVVIENVPGAGGMTGAARVARAVPDGYQFVLGQSDTHAQVQSISRNPQYDAATEFAPVGLIGEAPLVLITRKDLPVANFSDFRDYAKLNQSKMQFGSAGVGSTPHLACALVNSSLGIDVAHIPYRGSALAMQDLIGGRIDYQCATVAAASSQIANNVVKPIAILSKHRSHLLPNLPSAQEQGLPEVDASAWFAFFMPKNTPASIVNKLNAATIEAIKHPSVQQRLMDVGVELVSSERRSPDYLQKFVKTEIEKWAAVIKAANIKGE